MLDVFFGSPPPLWLPLIFGATGILVATVGSILRGQLSSRRQKVGACFCVLGLIAMTTGLLCIIARLSTGAPA